MGTVHITDTLEALSDDKSLALFNMCGFALLQDTGSVTSRLGITRRQYYSRINRLKDTGLVIRKNGKFFLTSFGKVVYESQILIGKAIEDCWKLKAIDSIEASLPAEERKRIIDTLIEKKNIKNLLLNYVIPSDQIVKFINSNTSITPEITVIDK